MDDIKFADGIYFKEPHQNAPDFVKGKLSIQKQKLMAWLEGMDAGDEGYINLDIKVAKSGKLYIAVDNWKPNNQQQAQQQKPQLTPQQQEQMDTRIEEDPIIDDDVPF